LVCIAGKRQLNDGAQVHGSAPNAVIDLSASPSDFITLKGV